MFCLCRRQTASVYGELMIWCHVHRKQHIVQNVEGAGNTVERFESVGDRINSVIALVCGLGTRTEAKKCSYILIC